MDDEERIAAVAACKWVDQVVEKCPYVMSAEYLDWVLRPCTEGGLGCDFVVHGDDPCVVDGKDVYQGAKDRGKFRSIPRTEGEWDLSLLSIHLHH